VAHLFSIFVPISHAVVALLRGVWAYGHGPNGQVLSLNAAQLSLNSISAIDGLMQCAVKPPYTHKTGTLYVTLQQQRAKSTHNTLLSVVERGRCVQARWCISPLGCAHKVTCRLSFLGRLWSLSQCAVALRHGMPGSVLIVLLEFLAPFTLNTRQNANDHLGPFFIITHQRERGALHANHTTLTHNPTPPLPR